METHKNLAQLKKKNYLLMGEKEDYKTEEDPSEDDWED